MFEPADASQTASATAHFGADGVYELKSAGNEFGAAVGEYRVLIIGQGEEHFSEDPQATKAPSPIPLKYSDYAAGLEATVEEGTQTIDFNLES